jgi:phosphatidylglycerol:prolipoprotein diacylglycerol transferase
MRPRINEFLLNAFDSPSILYLIPSGITIYFLALGITSWLLLRRCDKSGLNTSQAAVATLLAIVGGLVSARIYYLLHHYHYVLEHKEVIFRFGAGIASWGAYIGGLLIFVLYLHFKKQDVLKYLDVLASVLGLGPFFIRWACFLNGCCFGTPTDLPWAVRYPAPGSFAWRSHVEAGLVSSGETFSLPVHPVQIYLSLLGLFNFVLASLFWKKFAGYRGATFLFYWLVYGISRFLLEFLRGDVPRYTPFGYTLSQLVILIVLCAVMAGSWILFRNHSGETSKTSA